MRFCYWGVLKMSDLSDQTEAAVEERWGALRDPYDWLETPMLVLSDLIDERVPSHAADRYSIAPELLDIRRGLPKPIGRLVSARSLSEVRLRMHDRQAVALVVRACDRAIAEDLARRSADFRRHEQLLVRNVIVVPYDKVLGEVD